MTVCMNACLLLALAWVEYLSIPHVILLDYCTLYYIILYYIILYYIRLCYTRLYYFEHKIT